MSVDVSASWTCDWCGSTRDGYDADRKPPEGWSRVTLTGVAYKPQRDLCPYCARMFRGASEPFEKHATSFWWTLAGESRRLNEQSGVPL